jgi:hypothetical protein
MLKNEIKHLLNSAGKSDYRKMGVSFGILLLLIAGYCFYKEYFIAIYLGLGGCILLLSGLLIPILLKPLYNGWMALALTIGFFMSRILLALIFFFLFTPIGLIMRLLKKDPLDQKTDPSAVSYWIRRDKQKFDPEETERQF